MKKTISSPLLKMESIMSEVNLSKIENMIYVIRQQKVMMDSDLAELYGVEKKLNKAVQRNISRFSGDFMFQLDSKR
jgi:hypothetical protein